MSAWLREGRFVYELNERGVNRWCVSVQDAHTPEADLEKIARLIAAAPELLEALRSICASKYDQRSDSERCDHIFRLGEAAIAKVTGEQ